MISFLIIFLFSSQSMAENWAHLESDEVDVPFVSNKKVILKGCYTKLNQRKRCGYVLHEKVSIYQNPTLSEEVKELIERKLLSEIDVLYYPEPRRSNCDKDGFKSYTELFGISYSHDKTYPKLSPFKYAYVEYDKGKKGYVNTKDILINYCNDQVMGKTTNMPLFEEIIKKLTISAGGKDELKRDFIENDKLIKFEEDRREIRREIDYEKIFYYVGKKRKLIKIDNDEKKQLLNLVDDYELRNFNYGRTVEYFKSKEFLYKYLNSLEIKLPDENQK